jgi:hypothetical protein
VSIHVFLGPSLPVDEASRVLEAVYHPPVRAGDVLRLVDSRPEAIAIVDGYFEQAPSVRHKEILFALSNGIPVFGSASMGALRAAELAAFGMRGVGEVFSLYERGILEDDDEVAVNHGPEDTGYRNVSEAMVNLRHGLGRALAEGILSSGTHDLLLKRAKERFYAERSWRAVFADALAEAIPESELAGLRGFVERERPNLKRDDAVALIRHLASARGRIERHTPTFEFHVTAHWRELVERVLPANPDASSDDAGGVRGS